MKAIRDLLKPPHVTGRVEDIVVRGDPRYPARRIDSTRALAASAWPMTGWADVARQSFPRAKSR